MVENTNAIVQLNNIMCLTEDINTAARQIQQIIDKGDIPQAYIPYIHEITKSIMGNAGEAHGYAMGICFNLHSAEQQTPTGRGSLRLVK